MLSYDLKQSFLYCVLSNIMESYICFFELFYILLLCQAISCTSQCFHFIIPFSPSSLPLLVSPRLGNQIIKFDNNFILN